MTEYGRGPGSQPWHPEDPLYGDRNWEGRPSFQDDWGQQVPYGAHGAAQQAGGPYPSQYPQGQYDGWDANNAAGYPYADPGPYDSYDPYAGQGGYAGYPGSPGYPGDATGSHGQPGHGYSEYPGPTGYQQPVDPYGHPGHPGQYGEGVGDGPYPYYDVPRQRTPPEAGQGWPGEANGAPAPHPEWQDGGSGGPDPETGWDPGPDRGEHAFFADRDGDGSDGPVRRGRRDDASDPDAEDERLAERGSKNAKKKRGGKRRSGCACLVVSVVMVGGVGAAGYFGYDFYQSRFGSSPDYAGKGTGEVQVEIPEGASQSDMGDALKEAGVIKSSGAFVDAAGENDKALSIQAGTYTLRKQMSASAAIDLMLDPSSDNSLIVAEGLRASKVYSLVDKKLDVPEGTTKKAAKTEDLGLPKWAKNKPEGFLFPSKYSVSERSEPEDVLREMVKRAKAEHSKVDLSSKAKQHGKDPGEIIAIASLIQAEAQEDDEFGKVSRVIYNRLDQGMALGFDSTINYALGRSSLDTTVEDTRLKSPYNTYRHQGLPPGPIGNPGHQAIEAALGPTKGNWLYFVTVKPGDTRFSDTKAEHDRHVRDFNEEQRAKKEKDG